MSPIKWMFTVDIIPPTKYPDKTVLWMNSNWNMSPEVSLELKNILLLCKSVLTINISHLEILSQKSTLYVTYKIDFFLWNSLNFFGTTPRSGHSALSLKLILFFVLCTTLNNDWCYRYNCLYVTMTFSKCLGGFVF